MSNESEVLDLIDQLELVNPGKPNYNDLLDFLQLPKEKFESLLFTLQEKELIYEEKPGRIVIL